jgi:hypothetical protein
LEKEVLPDQRVADSLKHFVFVSTSLDKSDLGATIARKYGLTGVPSFLLIAPSGDLLDFEVRLTIDTAHFLKFISGLRTDNPVSGFSSRFDLPYPDFYTNFFPSFQSTVDSSAVSRYLDSRSDLEDEICFVVLLTQMPCRRHITWFLSHDHACSKKYRYFYTQRVERLYSYYLKRMISKKDSALFGYFEHAFYFTDSLQGFDRDLLRGFRYISFLGKSGLSWDLYASAIDNWEKKFGNSHFLLYCDDVYLNCMTPAVCRKMAGYMKAALAEEKTPTEDSYFKYAVLLHRGGEDSEAQVALRRAVELSPGDKDKINQQWAMQMGQNSTN